MAENTDDSGEADEMDWVQYQQNEIDNALDSIRTRFDHVASGVHRGILEGTRIQEHQNSRLEAYLEGYTDALEWAGEEVKQIDNLAGYALEREPPDGGGDD